MIYALATLSALAFLYAARLALSLISDRQERRARIARATRPEYRRAAPVRPRTFHNRPGQN